MSQAAANRKRRAEILKERREAGKVKPVPKLRQKQRAQVAKLKAEKLAIKKDLQKQKKKLADEIRSNKKKLADEKKRIARLQKDLKKKKEKLPTPACNDTDLGVIHRKMISAVPSVQLMKSFTSKDHSEHREAMSFIWASLRKYLSACNKTHFESAKRKKKKPLSSPSNAFGEGGGWKKRNVAEILPDIGENIDEAHYKRVTKQLFGSSGSGSGPRKKKKRIAPTFVSPL